MTTIPATEAPKPTAVSGEKTLGIISLITAIVSIVAGFVPLGSALAIVLGALAMRREPASRTLATAGILTGAIPIAISVGFAIIAIPLGLATALTFGTLGFWFW